MKNSLNPFVFLQRLAVSLTCPGPSESRVARLVASAVAGQPRPANPLWPPKHVCVCVSVSVSPSPSPCVRISFQGNLPVCLGNFRPWFPFFLKNESSNFNMVFSQLFVSFQNVSFCPSALSFKVFFSQRENKTTFYFLCKA